MNACLLTKVKIMLHTWYVGSLAKEKKWKFLQFVALFWLLKLDRPMTNFESMKMLFDFLKVENMLHKHLHDSSSWEMVETMHHIAMESMKIVIQKVKYIIVNYDEVTNINNQSWCSMHAYIVDGFRRLPLMLNLERLFSENIVDNLTALILRSLMEYGGLTIKHVASKLHVLNLVGL